MAKNDNLISANVLRVEKYSTSLRADLLLLGEGAETADMEHISQALKTALENNRAIKTEFGCKRLFLGTGWENSRQIAGKQRRNLF